MPRRDIDKNLFVKFETKPVINERKSYGEIVRDNDGNILEEFKGADRPIVENVDYVHIEIPKDRDNIVERPITACDKKLLQEGVDLSRHRTCRARPGLDDKPMIEECDLHRFFDEYVAFRAGGDQMPEGAPLKTWAAIDRATVEELAYFKVYTIEQLAGINDSAVGGHMQWRERARQYLDKQKHGEEAALRKRVSELEAKLAAKEKRP